MDFLPLYTSKGKRGLHKGEKAQERGFEIDPHAHMNLFTRIVILYMAFTRELMTLCGNLVIFRRMRYTRKFSGWSLQKIAFYPFSIDFYFISFIYFFELHVRPPMLTKTQLCGRISLLPFENEKSRKSRRK